MRKVTTQLTDKEYDLMKPENSGYKWNQLLKTGYFTKMNELNISERFAKIDAEIMKLSARLENINRRTVRIQEQSWLDLNKKNKLEAR